jgi:DNA primase
MNRLRSTHDDHLTSVSSRTTRHLATIEAARARHSLDDVARLSSHGHFDRSPSLQLHLDDGIWHCFGCGQTGDVVERVCLSEAVGWRQVIRILDSGCALTRAWAAHESSPSRRDSSSSRLPAGRYFAIHAAAVEMTRDPVLLVTADGPAL